MEFIKQNQTAPPATVTTTNPSGVRIERGTRTGSVSSDITAAASASPSPGYGAVHDVEGYGARGDAGAGWADSGMHARITQKAGKGLKARYALIALHLALLLVVLIVSAVLTGNIPLLVVHCYLFFAAVIYLPITVWVNVTRRKLPWDSAGAEVAYLAIHITGWSFSAIYHTILYIAENQSNRCQALYRYTNAQGLSRLDFAYSGVCSGSIASFSLGYLHFLLLVGWLIFDLLAVYAVAGSRPARAMGVSMGWVLRGWPRS